MTACELAALRDRLAAKHRRKVGYRASWRARQDEGRKPRPGWSPEGPIVQREPEPGEAGR